VDFNAFLSSKLANNDNKIDEYSGVFSQEVVKKFAFKLNTLSKNFIVTQRRIFYVFVELGQNIGFYSDMREEKDGRSIGCGSLVIYENENQISFVLGNVINNTALNVLLKKCKIINKLERDSLREFKRYQRNLIPGTNGGAHIGLIMVALTTRKKLEVDVLKIDDKKSFFTINVKIEKESV